MEMLIISNTKKLFTVQKRCMRILFGDLEAYKEKFKTWACVREFGKQTLGETFYKKEHTKPLFLQNANTLLQKSLLLSHEHPISKKLKISSHTGFWSLWPARSAR